MFFKGPKFNFHFSKISNNLGGERDISIQFNSLCVFTKNMRCHVCYSNFKVVMIGCLDHRKPARNIHILFLSYINFTNWQFK